MNRLPKVTIIIPTYNQEKYIGDAIESSLMQDYPDLEIIVTDDCSKDNTEEIAKRYLSDPRFRYVKNKKNLGRVGNYHNGAHNIANSQWLINLDGDDYFIHNSFVKEFAETIGALPDNNIVAYCYNHKNIDQIKDQIPYKELTDHSIIVSGRDYFLKYYKIGHFSHSGTLYRRDIGLKIGMYILPYQACDFHSIIRIIITGDIILDSRKIAHWRVHGTNTTIIESENKHKHAMLTFDSIEEFAKDYFSAEELKIWRKRMNKQSYIDYVSTYVWNHRNMKAIWLLLKTPHLSYNYLRLWAKLILNK